MEAKAETRRKGTDLTLFERKKIEEMRTSGCSAEAIAAEIGVHYATIYRELRRGATGKVSEEGVPVYSAALAQRKAALARSKKGRLSGDGDGRRNRMPEKRA